MGVHGNGRFASVANFGSALKHGRTPTNGATNGMARICPSSPLMTGPYHFRSPHHAIKAPQVHPPCLWTRLHRLTLKVFPATSHIFPPRASKEHYQPRQCPQKHLKHRQTWAMPQVSEPQRLTFDPVPLPRWATTSPTVSTCATAHSHSH